MRGVDEALACVQQNAGRFTAEEFFPNAASRDALLRFLKPRVGLYARLSEMHDSGLLGQMFPEFKAISCRVVRDFYHRYTVDEHTLLTIRNLERLVEAAPERRAVRPAARRGRIPELLVLALLYHDVGSRTTTTVIISRAPTWRARWPSAFTSIARRAKRSNF